jgi:hypothetical chaperone protein
MKKIKKIGIDFGTTNTGVAVQFEDGTVNLLKDTNSNMKTFPSEIYFKNKEEYFVGRDAQEEAAKLHLNGRHLRWLKRLLPRKLPVITIFTNTYEIEDLVAIIIKHAKEKLEQEFEIHWEQVELRVSYPVVLGDNEEQENLAKSRLEEAFKLAGFSSWELIPEPVAVAHFYAKRIHEKSNCLIFDCGGGTTDLSYVTFDNTLDQGFKTLGNGGTTTAGRDFDKALFMKSIAPIIGYGIDYKVLNKDFSIPMAIYTMLISSNETHKVVMPRFYKHITSAIVNSPDQERFNNLKYAVDNNKSIYLLSQAENLKIGLAVRDYVKIRLDLSTKVSVESSYLQFSEASKFVIEKLQKLLISFCADKPIPDFIIMTGGMSNHRIVKNLISEQFPTMPQNCFLYENTDAIVMGLVV